MKNYKSYMVEFEINGEYKWTFLEARSEGEAAFLVENAMIKVKGAYGTYKLLAVIECE